ncbi:MAG TPA: dihydropteroate synthase [Phycisphaerales bacterium]|nr:dihydropteroate synthase [Phycisphaerales bacterium]
MAFWRLSPSKQIDLTAPCVMAILNITPDSFSDGGRLMVPHQAADAAAAAVGAGARVLDIGGESTRPGAAPVSADEQMQRVVPAIMAIRGRGGALAEVAITVDTTSAAVAEAALSAGADAVNDQSAGLDDAEMLKLCAARGCGIVLMHRARRAAEDSYSDQYQQPPHYHDLVAEVAGFLRGRAEAALAAGIGREQIVLDPGLGFGKSVEHNLELIRGTGALAALGYPVLSGLSRKSFTGRVSLNRDSQPSERLAGTLALSVLHQHHGASVFRVHDVPEHVAALNAASRLAASHLNPK